MSYIHYIIIRQGKAKLCCILKLTSVFHHFPSVSPKQLCALAHRGYFRLVIIHILFEALLSWLTLPSYKMLFSRICISFSLKMPLC